MLSETATMTLTEFISARLDEDEAAARAIQWPDPIDPAARGRYEDASWYFRDGDHMDRWSPARVLAEVEAKRWIVAMHQPDRLLENWYWSQRKCRECGGTWHHIPPFGKPTDIGPEQGCPTLRALAAVYADHPDYDPTWAPTEQERP